MTPKWCMYSVYDVVIREYMGPFVARNDAAASRQFADAVRNPEHLFGRNPSDFTLYRLAGFDDENGFFTDSDGDDYGTLGPIKILSGVEVQPL